MVTTALPEFKQTDVGLIPHDWAVKSLGEIGEPIIGLTYSPSDVKPQGLLVLRSSNVGDGVLVYDDNVFVDVAVSEKLIVRKDDILVCVRNGSRPLIGKSALIDDRAAGMTFGAFMSVFRSQHSRFVFYCLQSDLVKRQIRAHLGATINQITNASLRSFRIPFPAPEEQEVIVSALSDLDASIDALDKLIAKKRAMKIGAMQQLLTGMTRLPGFSAPWQEVTLGSHVSYVKTVALSRAQLDDESPTRYVHYGDIHTRSSVTLDAAREDMPRASSTLLRGAGRLEVGDLIFADASEDQDGVGKSVEVVSVPTTGVVPGLHTIAARFDKAVLADGFKSYLQFNPSFRRALLRLAAGTKVLATTRSFISSITLKLPEIDEQRAIATVLSEQDSEIATLVLRREKMKGVKRGMMQALLAGRVRLKGGKVSA